MEQIIQFRSHKTIQLNISICINKTHIICSYWCHEIFETKMASRTCYIFKVTNMSGFVGQGKMIMIILSKATNFLSSLTPGRWIVNTFFTGIPQVKEFCQYSTRSLVLYFLQVPSMFKVQTNVQFWSSPLPVT